MIKKANFKLNEKMPLFIFIRKSRTESTDKMSNGKNIISNTNKYVFRFRHLFNYKHHQKKKRKTYFVSTSERFIIFYR